MIVVAIVIGIAVALSVAGWVPVVRDALRADHVLPGPPVREAAQAVAAAAAAAAHIVHETPLQPEAEADAVSA